METVPRRWIQVDFDIPEDQPTARSKLVKKIYQVGGRRLTLSVYHLPYREDAMEVIQGVAKIPGAVVHVVRPEYELTDAKNMAQRYIDDVVDALNHAEQVTKTVENEQAEGELEEKKAVSKLKRMVELVDLAEPAALRINDDRLMIQMREVRAYVLQVLKAISPRAMVGRGVKAWQTRRANAEKKLEKQAREDKAEAEAEKKEQVTIADKTEESKKEEAKA